MNAVLKVFLSMSFSGSLLILILLAGKRFMKDRISRQWQYYIWLIVILRLLLPFGPETNLMGKVYQAAGQAMTQAAALPRQQSIPDSPEDVDASTVGLEQNSAKADGALEALAGERTDIMPVLVDRLWLVWLVAALGMLIRKITVYQSFLRYITAGSAPVSDIALLDRLALAAEQAGIQKPVELCINPLISSPLLIGFFHPCIVLPSEDVSPQDFQFIVLHELTHYRRRDMFYKWLVQVTVCLHWFNPLVHLMSREITKACEFSCDEAVLTKMGSDSAQDYGGALLDAMAAVGKYKESLGAVTLSENKQLLKERLGAIMRYKRKPAAIRILTGVLTLCMILGAAFAGVYSVSAADAPSSAGREKTPQAANGSPVMETLDLKGATYYLVHDEAQLRAIGTGEYGMDQNYMQQADIQLSTKEWEPIGTWDSPFTGTFNGNGYEIIGLTMTDPDAKVIGLFGVAEKAHIYNVILRDYDITSAGRNVQGKSVGAVLAVGQGSRSYDNSVYPKETGEDVQHSKATEKSLSEIERYYEAGSLPLFKIAFSRLDESTQRKWLEKLYAGDDFAFFSAAVGGLDENSVLITEFAEKAYADGEIAFFSTLTDCMEEAELEFWLDRALEDGRWSFQSMLFDKLGRDDEFDKLEEKREKEWAEAQMAEYKAAGVTIDGKNYYYRGQLVNIFLDIRPNKSFYTLDMNPSGAVNIKIVRNADNEITGVAYMTEAEVAELLDDLDDEDDPDDETETGEPEVIPINVKTMAGGEIIWLGEYAMSDGDKIWYDVAAEAGPGLQIGLAKPGDEVLKTTYYSVKNVRQKNKTLKCTAEFTFGSPVKPGTYQIFLCAADGPLNNVRGSVSIAKAN